MSSRRKAIFDPVAYVVFNGMSVSKLRDILLRANPPQNAAAERVQASIGRASRRETLSSRHFMLAMMARLTRGNSQAAWPCAGAAS